MASSSTPLCSSLTTTVPRNSLCKTSSLFHHHSLNHRRDEFLQYPNGISSKNHLRRTKKFTPCSKTESGVERKSSSEVDCVGTGLDVECVVNPSEEFSKDSKFRFQGDEGVEWLGTILEWGLLISPFFFWGTAMVAMKEVLPKTGPFFVSSFRLIPAGLMLVAFAASRGRNFPSGFNAWLSITLFALVDATCFQGFLAEGLQRTSAGLGSVIIDSQPLTVAVLAALLFGESIGSVGAAGLVLGVIGLLLLEVPALSFDNSNFSLWGSGEWWMFLAAQSMAVGTVMVRWVSKYSDPVMATGWHMVIGGIPLVAISILNHEPVISGSLMELTSNDLLALLYTSIFGSAISYGVYFYNATRGSLTKLSSLTFLTPMFASIFGFLYLDETFTPVQLIGAFVTVAAIYMVNYKSDTK
ncbi:WAT1-related protein At3g02690, chloroplastic [Solanum dulcamara]|uniref:WAT1-related protein At3g02690, chloroplastic n=1 Tax=Solanum dulcamara TaxID=45834 RepID=UPI002485A45C|nr:WAT1-related protein At3g02690, chloroplastic [Solanum dulcamara]